jgi:hypothetical protein
VGVVGVCVWACGGVCGRGVGVCVSGGRSPLALEHSALCASHLLKRRETKDAQGSAHFFNL